MKFKSGCDIEAFIKSLTLEQKIDLQATASPIHTKDMSDIGIPVMGIADGVTGINYLQVYLDGMHKIKGVPQSAVLDPLHAEAVNNNLEDLVLRDYDSAYADAEEGTLVYELTKQLVEMKPNGVDPTCFPSGVVLGSTWNPELVGECGKYLGEEMAMYGIDVILGPNMDIQRDPLCGRGYECYSEDPFLVGEIGSAFIQGMQQAGVAGCAKHFAVNNQETNRSSINTIVSERALREIYLKGFETAVKKGQVKSFMMAYNKVNGEHCAANSRLMREIIRGEWKYQGCIVSDWGAASDEAASINAGLDMVLPQRKCDIRKAIEDGTLKEEELDRCVYWILKMYEGLKGITGRPDTSDYSDEAALKTIYACIADGAVLLKNDNALPLALNTKTAFYGKRTKKLIDCGGGSTQVFTRKTTNIWDRALAINGEADCVFEKMPEGTEALVYTIAYPGHEHIDNLSLFPEHEDRVRIRRILIEAKDKGLKTIVVLNTAGPVDSREWIEYADALLCIYLPGCEGGRAVADMIYGKAAPAGKLSQTFPVKYEDAPSSINFPGYNGVVNYGEDIFVGYRYYDRKELEPAFPFGHGLTYTTFSIESGLNETVFDTGSDKEITVPVTVTNTGDREGAEVVQLYVGQNAPFVQKPLRELKAFKKCSLKPGERKKIGLKLGREAFMHFDESQGGWCTDPGAYTIYIGSSSRNLPVKVRVEVRGRRIYGIGAHTTINEIAEYDFAVECMTEAVFDFKERISEFIRDFDGEPLKNVYDAVMSDYHVNPIHGAMIFEQVCNKMNTVKKV